MTSRDWAIAGASCGFGILLGFVPLVQAIGFCAGAIYIVCMIKFVRSFDRPKPGPNVVQFPNKRGSANE